MTQREDSIWQRAMYLTSRPDFKQDILRIRHTHSLPADGFKSDDAINEWREKYAYYKLVDIEDDIENAIDLAVARIIAKPEYELSPGWHNSIKRLVLLSNFDDMQLPTSLGTQVIEDKVTGRPTIHVIVSEDTTKQDYVNEWDNIEHVRQLWKLKAPKQRRRQADPNILKRKKLAYDTWVKTGSYEASANAVEKTFSEQLKEDAYTADTAKTDIHNFMKQAGI